MEGIKIIIEFLRESVLFIGTMTNIKKNNPLMNLAISLLIMVLLIFSILAFIS